MTVTGRFTLLVALGVVPVVLLGAEAGAAWAALAGWLVLAVGLGALDLSLAASPRRVALARDLPDRLRLGETVESELVVRNLGERMLRATVRDGWSPSAGVHGRNRADVDVPPGEGRRVVQRLTPTRRGDRRSDAVTIRSHGPMRLWARQATLAAPGRLRVLPPFHSRAHLPSRLTRLRELDGRTPLLIRGQGTEFDSLREYVRGDDVRSIDWRATARRSDPEQPGSMRLMVRTWRPERDRRIVIVADTSRTAAARIGDEPRLDTAFEASLLLAALASHAGDRVDFLAWDRRLRGRVHGASGPELLARMVDTMAGIDAELVEADWAGLPAQVRRVTSRRALVVLLTAADSPGSARGLLAALPQLTARHRVVVASVADPALAELVEADWAGLPAQVRRVTSRRALVVLLTAADSPGSARGLLAALPQLTARHKVVVASVADPALAEAVARRDELADVYAAAAAERSRLDADRVAAAIDRLGGSTVTASPHGLPPALADHYLALKAAGQL